MVGIMTSHAEVVSESTARDAADAAERRNAPLEQAREAAHETGRGSYRRRRGSR